MRWVKFTVGLGACAFAAGLSLAPASAEETIKVGFNVPLTGFGAADGTSALNGAELAVEQINAAGGIDGKKLELVVYDDQGLPKEAAPIAIKTITRDGVVAGISGSYSGATRAAATIYQEYETPYISAYAVHPDITRSGNYVFRTSFVGEVQGRAAAKFIGETLGKKKVAILAVQNDFGKSLADGFREKAGDFGIEVAGEYGFSMDDRQFGPLVAQVKAVQPEAVYFTGYYFNAGPLVEQLRAGGVDVPLVGMEGVDGVKFIEIARDAAEGVIITTSLDRDSSDPVTRDFIEGFEAKAGYPADMVGASSHTAVQVLAAALRAAGSEDKAALRDAIANSEVKASTGVITFNALGEVVKDVQMQVVRGGAWHHHSVISDRELLAPPTE